MRANLAILVVAALASPSIGVAEEENAGEREAHRARMKELAGSLHVYTDSADRKSEVELVDTPVLRYADDTRQLHESSLWVWGGTARPSAIVAIEFYSKGPKGPRWLYEIASLSTGLIRVEREGDLRWTAKAPGLRLQPIAKAGPVDEKPLRRLAQMKQLCRRFTAYEQAAIGGRIELRLLATPIHRYTSAADGLVEGAIFSFANGTNPEVLLLIEAQEIEGRSAQWHYGLVRMTGAAVVAQLNGHEVWSHEEADPPSDKGNYVNGWIKSE